MNQPEQFGKYILLGCVAVGGMAEIYKAHYADPSADQMDIALKRVLPSYTEDESFVTMFKDEGMIAQRLNHPNIVRVYDVGDVNNDWYIAMEFIHGTDLRVLSDACEKYKKRFTNTQIARIICETAKALDYAHKCKDANGQPLNIVHRDATPHNIMVTYDSKVKLMDFGIAKAASRATKTRVGTVKGKSSYMSPEQARGKQLDGRSDMFTIGTVAWELLTGYRLFKASNDFEILSKVLKAEIVPPCEIDKNIPQKLSDIIMKTLIRDREQRYADCGELAEALEEFIQWEGDGSDANLGQYVMALTGYQGHTPAELPNYTPQVGLVKIDDNGNIERVNNSVETPAPAAMPQADPHVSAPQPIAFPNPAAPAGMPPTSGQFPQPGMQQTFTSYPGLNPNQLAESKPETKFPLLMVIISVVLLLIAAAFFMLGMHFRNMEPEIAKKSFETPDASISIKTSPPGATVKRTVKRRDEVVVNNDTISSLTPINNLAETKLGDVITLEISKEGFEPMTIEQTILQTSQLFNVALVQEGLDELFVELTVETDPPGSVIEIDGDSKGKSPVTISDIPVGKSVSIVAITDAKGYAEVSTTYSNPKAGADTLRLVHEKAKVAGKDTKTTRTPRQPAAPAEPAGPAFITVTSKPWAIVMLDGKRLGNTPVNKKEITSGKHKLTLDYAAKGERVNKDINVKKGAEFKIGYDLAKGEWY